MRATDLFVNEGYNCAEAVLGGIVGCVDGCNHLASGFGGGIGGRGDICGAASGAIMALGAEANIRAHPDRTKGELQSMVMEFLRSFEHDCGALDCRDLIPLDEMFDIESDRRDYFASPDRKQRCAEFVDRAQTLAETLLQEQGWASS